MKKKTERLANLRKKRDLCGCERMASSQKNVSPPPPAIAIPKTLAPLIEAFHASSEEVARRLVSQAISAVYGRTGRKQASEDEIDYVCFLMEGIQPADTLETLYGSQIIVCHMLGMKKLSEAYPLDRKLGMRLLRLENEAIQALDRKRKAGGKNITANYSYSNSRNNEMPMIITSKGK